MPIRPDLKHLYGKDWREISRQIRERAGNRCEWCGVKNGAIGYRDAQGRFHDDPQAAEVMAIEGERGVVRIVLTVAHLDHNPANCDPANLAALCQRCHLRYDANEHARHAAETRRRKLEAQTGQGRLL